MRCGCLWFFCCIWSMILVQINFIVFLLNILHNLIDFGKCLLMRLWIFYLYMFLHFHCMTGWILQCFNFYCFFYPVKCKCKFPEKAMSFITVLYSCFESYFFWNFDNFLSNFIYFLPLSWYLSDKINFVRSSQWLRNSLVI